MTPALLLHGFLGRGADWAPVAARLAETRAVLTPDLPGHGSEPGTGTASRLAEGVGRDAADVGDPERVVAGRDADVEAFDVAVPRPGGLACAADRLAAYLDAAGVDAADVAGYSMGGRLALVFALRHPRRVRRLVLVSASPGLRTPGERAERRAHDAALARDIVADFPGFLDRWTRQPLFSSLTEAQRARLVADRRGHGRPEALARALVGMGTGAMPSLWEPLRRLRVETSAVAGALDPTYVALATSSDLVAAGVRGYVLPGAGHNLLAEAPADLSDLLDYLLP